MVHCKVYWITFPTDTDKNFSYPRAPISKNFSYNARGCDGYDPLCAWTVLLGTVRSGPKISLFISSPTWALFLGFQAMPGATEYSAVTQPQEPPVYHRSPGPLKPDEDTKFDFIYSGVLSGCRGITARRGSAERSPQGPFDQGPTATMH